MAVVIVEGKGIVLGVKLRRPIVTNGAFATRLFSDYFEDLLLLLLKYTAGARKILIVNVPACRIIRREMAIRATKETCSFVLLVAMSTTFHCCSTNLQSSFITDAATRSLIVLQILL